MLKYEEFCGFFSPKVELRKRIDVWKKQGDTGKRPRNVSGLEVAVMLPMYFPILQISPQVSTFTFCTKQL